MEGYGMEINIGNKKVKGINYEKTREEKYQEEKCINLLGRVT